MSTISRRDLFKFGGVAAAGAMGVSMLGGCAPQQPVAATEEAAAAAGDGTPAFFVKPEPITDIADTRDYDVVVIGAGAAGVPAAISAHEAGAKVALLQKEATAVSQGNTCDSIIVDQTAPGGVEAVVSLINADCCHLSDREQVRLWAYNSGEALKWLWNIGEQAGAQMVDSTAKWTSNISNINGYDVTYFAFDFGPKPYNTGNGMRDIADWAEQQGVEIFYSTPAAQLVQDESGAVTGVIAEGENGLVQYNASRGVVLATGGFLGNKDMMDELGVVSHKFCSNHMGGEGRNGDGIKLAHWAGADMDSSHAGSMLIFDRGCITSVSEEEAGIGIQGGGYNAGMWWPGSQPFLRVNKLGQRFCNEDGPYDFVFNLAMQQPGHFWWQVFDGSSWEDVVNFGTTICSRVVAAEGAKNCFLLGTYYPCRDAKEWDEVYVSPNVEQGNLLKFDTLEELADAMGFDAGAKDNFLATVKRYNEITESGTDTDHGKAPWRLSKIDEPPYYAAKMSGWALATLSGIHVNYNMQAVDTEGKAIEGLYMSGLDVGGFFNGNYPEYYGGLCMGRCVTLAWLAAHSLMGEEYPTPLESARAAF